MTFWKSPVQFIRFLITPFTQREREGIASLIDFQTQGVGYFKMQSTRPQTLGYGLADSPVGMLAWIYEKLVKWSDSYPWTDEEGAYLSTEHPVIYAVVFGLILASIDLDVYLLVFACGTSSIGEDLSRDQLPGFAPLASNCACRRIFLSKGFGSNTSSVSPLPFRACLSIEAFLLKRSRRFFRAISNIVFESEHDSGGHFAAYEKPEALVDDLRKMFGKGGPAAGVVPGHNGF
jgi:hypothetical protein